MKINIQKAFEFALAAHNGQTRKDEVTPYILHPMQVAANVHWQENSRPESSFYDVIVYFDKMYMIVEDNYSFYDPVICAIIVALLHDVIEDCNITLEQLVQEFGEWIREPMIHVSSITKGDPRPRKIRKQVDEDHYAKGCDIAHTVKVADMMHNISDMGNNPNADLKYQRMYLLEKKSLLNRLDKARIQFRNFVMTQIDDKLNFIEEKLQHD